MTEKPETPEFFDPDQKVALSKSAEKKTPGDFLSRRRAGVSHGGIQNQLARIKNYGKTSRFKNKTTLVERSTSYQHFASYVQNKNPKHQPLVSKIEKAPWQQLDLTLPTGATSVLPNGDTAKGQLIQGFSPTKTDLPQPLEDTPFAQRMRKLTSGQKITREKPRERPSSQSRLYSRVEELDSKGKERPTGELPSSRNDDIEPAASVSQTPETQIEKPKQSVERKSKIGQSPDAPKVQRKSFPESGKAAGPGQKEEIKKTTPPQVQRKPLQESGKAAGPGKKEEIKEITSSDVPVQPRENKVSKEIHNGEKDDIKGSLSTGKELPTVKSFSKPDEQPLISTNVPEDHSKTAEKPEKQFDFQEKKEISEKVVPEENETFRPLEQPVTKSKIQPGQVRRLPETKKEIRDTSQAPGLDNEKHIPDQSAPVSRPDAAISPDAKAEKPERSSRVFREKEQSRRKVESTEKQRLLPFQHGRQKISPAAHVVSRISKYKDFKGVQKISVKPIERTNQIPLNIVQRQLDLKTPSTQTKSNKSESTHSNLVNQIPTREVEAAKLSKVLVPRKGIDQVRVSTTPQALLSKNLSIGHIPQIKSQKMLKFIHFEDPVEVKTREKRKEQKPVTPLLQNETGRLLAHDTVQKRSVVLPGKEEEKPLLFPKPQPPKSMQKKVAQVVRRKMTGTRLSPFITSVNPEIKKRSPMKIPLDRSKSQNVTRSPDIFSVSMQEVGSSPQDHKSGVQYEKKFEYVQAEKRDSGTNQRQEKNTSLTPDAPMPVLHPAPMVQSGDTVQRITETNPPVSPESSTREPPVQDETFEWQLSEPDERKSPNYALLARQVFPLIKRLMAVEKERSTGKII